MILGAPAKVVRELTPQEIIGLQAPSKIYVANAQRYLKGLRPL